jgi:hypothetical protein
MEGYWLRIWMQAVAPMVDFETIGAVTGRLTRQLGS